MARSTKALRGELDRAELVAEAIRVSATDWPRISSGRATEFRLSVAVAPVVKPLPTLAILYFRDTAHRRLETRLMTVSGRREEPLGAITEDGLAAAGYGGSRAEAFALFRREWKITHKKFEPLRRMAVFTVRTIGEGDIEEAGVALVNHLYGDHLAAPKQTRTIPLVPQF